jgi:hypothetical protein
MECAPGTRSTVLGRLREGSGRTVVAVECALMPKARPNTRDFDWKGTGQTDYLGVSLMHFGEMHGTRRTRARCRLRPLKFVSSVDGSEVRCAHFPSVACPTENDETTDPMGGRRKTVPAPTPSVTVATEISMKQTLRLAAAPACGRTLSLRPNRGTCNLPSSGRADLESVGVLRTRIKARLGVSSRP